MAEIYAPNIGGGETEVDWISQPGNLVDACPTFAESLEAINDHKSLLEEIRKISAARTAIGMSPGGTMMKIACFPHELYCAIVQVNPFFLKDKREFYRWLDRNPFWRVGRSIAR